MKKVVFCFCVLFLCMLLSACKGTQASAYNPAFEIGEHYRLEDETIVGTVLGEEYISLFSVFTTDENFIIFGDSTAETFLESGVIPLKEGTNRLVVRFYEEEREREYELLIEYIPIRSLSVEIIDTEKTYHVGEAFDRSTIRVFAETRKGETLETEQYTAEYAFSELGEQDVGIAVGDYYESITVMVTEEYLPTLDSTLSAHGVKYAIKEESAVLVSAKNASGFFAVPRAVISEGKEYPVTAIGNGAFARTALSEILIPEGVETLGIGVFSGCDILSSVDLPDTLKSIGGQCFSDCVSLDYVILPEGISVIDYSTFYGCSSLFRVVLPETLVSIGEGAFSGCEALKNIEFPQTLREIGKEAFAGCKTLARVILSDLQLLDDLAFADCESLSAFVLSKADVLGENVLRGTNATVYTVEGSALLTYASDAGLSAVCVHENTPMLISLPETFAIEDDYPYHEVFALYLTENGISALRNYEVSYAGDACGSLSATLTWGDFLYEYEVTVTYTETVLIDTDTRGARYVMDPVNKTAVLVYLPPYLKPSKVFRPETEGLFLLPTALSCPDGIYEVIGIEGDVLNGCENVTEIFIPSR